MSTGSLELRRVCKRYGEVAAVTDISLSVRPGEFLTLLGPSGSGKTTTLVMIAGLARPTSGAILLDGLPLDPLPPYRRELGVVFQNYALFPHMTVAKNVAFPLEMRRVPRTEVTERVAKVLTQVDLPDYGARFPRQLSGGQQQRVALARAMVFRPRILLMDEPLGALDRRTREQMQIEIMHLHRELKMTIVYVTHDQEEALMMSTRIAVFNQGKLEQIGEPTELYERPATRFVASFLGDSNFFLGRVTQSGTEYLSAERGRVPAAGPRRQISSSREPRRGGCPAGTHSPRPRRRRIAPQRERQPGDAKRGDLSWTLPEISYSFGVRAETDRDRAGRV